MNHTEEKLGTESLGSLMLSMGIPTLVAQMINLLYNIVDRVYIGQGVGREALTGLGLALPAITIVSAFSALAGAGGAPLAAIALGQGDREKAERITGNVFTLLCVFSAIIMFVFYAAQKPFLYLVGASDATYPYASEYLSIYLIGTICVQIVLGLNPFITAQGQSKTAMGSVLIGAALNIILDPIFIFVFHMGVKGAALATILSQLAGTALYDIEKDIPAAEVCLPETGFPSDRGDPVAWHGAVYHAEHGEPDFDRDEQRPAALRRRPVCRFSDDPAEYHAADECADQRLYTGSSADPELQFRRWEFRTCESGLPQNHRNYGGVLLCDHASGNTFPGSARADVHAG